VCVSKSFCICALSKQQTQGRMSRKEKEEAEAQRKKDAYDKLHKAGKTDEYKKDMERLQEARKVKLISKTPQL
jgi:hypothetical protein